MAVPPTPDSPASRPVSAGPVAAGPGPGPVAAGHVGGTLLVALAAGFGAYAIGRLTVADSSVTPPTKLTTESPATLPPASPADEAARELGWSLRVGDDCFASTLMRPRPDQLTARLSDCIDSLPTSVATAPELAQILDEWSAIERRRGDAALVARLDERASAVDPDPIRLRVRAAAAAGDLVALRALAAESLAAAWPAATELLLARSLDGVGLADAALRVLDRSLEARPDDFNAQIAAAELLARQPPEGVVRARERVAGARALRPESRRALLLEAELVLRTPDDASEAIALLQAAERQAPEDAEIACALGVALLRGRYFDEARGRFERALKLEPTLARAAAGVAQAWFGLEEYPRAIGSCERSLKIGDNPDARDLLATACYEMKNPKRAFEALDRAIAAWPDDAAIVDHHAASLAMRGQYAEAIAGLRRAVQFEPWSAEFVNDLAWELVNGGDPAQRRPGQGLELAERACAIEPGNSWHENTRGVACYRVGEFDRAVEVLEAACELPRGGGAFDHYFLAMACHQLGAIESALDHFNEADLLTDPRDAEMVRARAEASALLGLSDEAAGAGDGGSQTEPRDG
ncbi:MAG: tetratricopeptide repeat protein [Planctomycetes bacterium]|nr:tetratricopeptide repeat protein [Planctomycetota bacterium]